MLALLRRGLPAAESARLALEEAPAVSHERALLELVRGWEALDASRVHRALDELLVGPEPEVTACRVIIPQLNRLAGGMAQGPADGGLQRTSRSGCWRRGC